MELRFKSLSKNYNQKKIFENANNVFSHSNELSVILGESGTGKSTLLNILFGIDQDYEGSYYIDDKDSKKLSDKEWDELRSYKIQIVYQDFKLLEKFTVSENLYFANHLSKKNYRKREKELLKLLNLENEKNTIVKDISGGQKQRVAIARALLNNPEVILLDEPTGNLDKENTVELFNYLTKIKKQGKSIYVITHDERILPFADNIYRLEDKKIVQVKSNDELPSTEEKDETYLIKRGPSIDVLINYVRKDIRRNFSNILLTSIPMVLVLFIFTLLFTGFKQVSLDSFTDLFAGLDKKTIYIDSQVLTEKYQSNLNKRQIQSSTDGNRLNFSEGDIQQIQSLDYVKKVVPFNLSSSIFDADNNELQESLSKESFPNELKKLPSFTNAPSVINLAFQSLLLPNDDFNYYNPNHIHLLTGDLPKEKNDILIPDFYKEYLVSKNNTSKIINLPVKTLDGKFKKGSYKVTGIYQTNYKKTFIPQIRLTTNNAFPIYTIYRDLTDLNQLRNKKTYQQSKDMNSSNAQTVDYLKKIYGTYEDYLRSVGTGKESLLIIANNEKDVPKVTRDLQKIFPNYQMRSRYSLKSGEFAETYRQLVLTLCVGSAGMAVILLIIFVFLNKQSIAQKKKELATLFSLGYSRWAVKVIICCEIISQFIVIYGTSMVIVSLFNYLYLTRSAYNMYFVNMFSLENQFVILGIIIVTSFFSTIWGVSSIKKKKLIENLK